MELSNIFVPMIALCVFWNMQGRDESCEDPMMDTGGYWATPQAALPLHLPTPEGCTDGVPRLSVTEMSPRRFAKEFYGRSPLLVSGAMTEDTVTARRAWHRAELLDGRLAQSTVAVGTSGSIAAAMLGGGDQHIRVGAFAAETDAEHAVLRARSSTAVVPALRSAAGDPQYIFDKSGVLASAAPEAAMAGALALNRSFGSEFMADDDSTIFLLGRPGSAVAFHNHGSAYNLLVHGRKRWLLYPPTTFPPVDYPTFLSVGEWLADIYPTLSKDERPIEFEQRAGEALYIPEGWYHSAVSLQETVGLASKSKRPASKALAAWWLANSAMPHKRVRPPDTEARPGIPSIQPRHVDGRLMPAPPPFCLGWAPAGVAEGGTWPLYQRCCASGLARRRRAAGDIFHEGAYRNAAR